ncbi:MAG: flippase [Planctomycetota bacterium]|jgi:O-antigen/teichoic acid export membrane protein
MSSISRGLKNASYLAIGNFTGQLVMFLGIMYIARKLGPAEFGVYTTVGTFVGVFQIFLFIGLNKVVLREGSKDVSAMGGVLERTIGVRIMFILTAVMLCVSCVFFAPYELRTKLYIVMFSAHLVWLGIDSLLVMIYQANEKMQFISIFNLAAKAGFVILAILLLHFGFDLVWLFAAFLLAHFTTLIVNYRFSKRFAQFKLFSRIYFDKELLKPALVFSLLGIVTVMATRVDLFMISLLGTSEDVGIYSVAYNIARQGLMLRNVTGMAFFPIFVKRFHNRQMQGRKLIKYSVFLATTIFMVTLVLSLFVKPIVTAVFGAEYEQAGKILRVLLFFLAFPWASLPFTNALQATHNEKLGLYIASIMAVLNIPLNIVFFYTFGLIGIAYSTLVVFGVGAVLQCVLTYFVMKKQNYLA